eukprot:1265625-Pyramimonas_sp.AAC.1
MEGGWFSKCGSRLSVAHIRFQHVAELHGLRARRFQHVDVALAPRTLVQNIGTVPRIPMINAHKFYS